MKPADPAAPDLILDLDPSVDRAHGRQLIDAPKLDEDPPTDGFNWRPTVLLVTAGVVAMLAVAYL